MSRTPTTLMSFALLVPFAEPQGYVFTRIATALEPGALSPGMSKPELLEALRKKALAELRAAEASELDSYGWVDQGKGVVRLPLAEAMKLTLREWQNPAAARSNLIARVEKAAAVPPPAPAKPNPFE